MVYIRPLWFDIPLLLESIEVSGEISIIKRGEGFLIHYPEGKVEYDTVNHVIKTHDLTVHVNMFHWLQDGCHPATIFAALVNAACEIMREGVSSAVIVETCFLDDYGVETPYYYNDKESVNIELPDKIIARVYRKQA